MRLWWHIEILKLLDQRRLLVAPLKIVLHDCHVVTRHCASVVVRPIVIAAWRTQETIIVLLSFATGFDRGVSAIGR